MIKELYNKILRNQRLLPAIDFQIQRSLSEQRRLILESEIINETSIGVTDEKLLESGNLIVSLTSYGKRLYDVAYTIQSIIRQTQKPNRIILWIDSKDSNIIPNILKHLQKRGLEIIPTRADIRSYKKLIHSLEQFPEDTIITIDDDVFYEYDLIERLLNAHVEHPTDICSMRVHRITRDREGKIKPYNDWNWTISENGCHPDNFLTGVGGVLYPPHSLAEDVLNMSLFKKIAPTADDVWFFFMARLKGTQIRKVDSRNKFGNDFLENYAFHDEGLLQINTKGECLNDQQISAVASYFDINI